MNPENLLHPIVGAYLAIVVLAQVLLAAWRYLKSNAQEARRRRQGLDDEVLVHTQARLETLRHKALVESSLFILTVFASPFLLLALWGGDPEARQGLAVQFAALLIWVLVSGSEVGKAFLGGLAFRSLAAFSRPLQVGDRVWIDSHSGKVISLGVFRVSLQTLDDDIVSVPTASLWAKTVVSANRGDRSSLCVMPFYLAPFTDSQQLDDAENALWDAVQASSYFAFTRPLQIFLDQREEAIVLTAKAYVASTYDEPLFKSDVARLFLKKSIALSLPLASRRWRESRPPDRAPHPGKPPQPGAPVDESGTQNGQ